MMQRIVLCIIVISISIYVLKVVMPVWEIVTKSEAIFWIYQKVFDIYPEERQQIFQTGSMQTISYGKIRICFYNTKEACAEFEKCIDELLMCYEKHSRIVNASFILQKDKDKLHEIRERVKWLKNRP